VRTLTDDHFLGEFGTAGEVRDGFNQMGEIFEGLFFIKVGKFDESSFLEGVQ
jgi:hypothetical protein